jgi:hypothetical protein
MDEARLRRAKFNILNNYGGDGLFGLGPGRLISYQPFQFLHDLFNNNEIAEKPCPSGSRTPDFHRRPAIAGLFRRIYPALL